MAFRHRTSIRIAPGFRVNIGKRGVGLSAGTRKTPLSLHRRGQWESLNIPDAGVTYRERIAGETTRNAKAYPSLQLSTDIPDVARRIEQVRIRSVDGSIRVFDEHGQDLGEDGLQAAKSFAAESLRKALDTHMQGHSALLESFRSLHAQTPSPEQTATYLPTTFEEPAPEPPRLRKLGLIERFMSKKRGEVERQNFATLLLHREATKNWQSAKEEHEQFEAERKSAYRLCQQGDWSAITQGFEDVLEDIDWPTEGDISVDTDELKRLFSIEVELPDIEQLPSEDVAAYKRGIGLSVKPFPQRKKQQRFCSYAHSMLFRLIGEAFTVHSDINTVLATAFKTEINDATGQANNVYLISVLVHRKQWTRLNFQNLDAVDPIIALGRFNIARSLTKMRTLIPISSEQISALGFQ